MQKPCKTVQNRAKPCKTVQNRAKPCKTVQAVRVMQKKLFVCKKTCKLFHMSCKLFHVS